MLGLFIYIQILPERTNFIHGLLRGIQYILTNFKIVINLTTYTICIYKWQNFFFLRFSDYSSFITNLFKPSQRNNTILILWIVWQNILPFLHLLFVRVWKFPGVSICHIQRKPQTKFKRRIWLGLILKRVEPSREEDARSQIRYNPKVLSLIHGWGWHCTCIWVGGGVRP